jgi:O-antigen/teichoic acid export membrane protein
MVLMQSSLKSKAVSGLLWSGLDGVSQQVLVLGIGIILARLLDRPNRDAGNPHGDCR